MNGRVVAGVVMVVVGGGLVVTQVVAEVPWQAGCALGLFLVALGLAAISDATSGYVDDDARGADEDLAEFDREERDLDRMGDMVEPEDIPYLRWPRRATHW